MQDGPHKEALLTEGKQELCHKGSSAKEGRQWVSCYTTVGGKKRKERKGRRGRGQQRELKRGIEKDIEREKEKRDGEKGGKMGRD